MNIFDPEESCEKGSKDTGVNKALLLGIVNGAQENNYNLRKILELVDLSKMKFFLAADLKLINCILELSVSI